LDFNFFDNNSYDLSKLLVNNRLKLIIALIIIILFHIPFISFQNILFLVHLALISLLYNVPEKSSSFLYLPLRSIPILKIYLITYVWASMSTLLPVILGNKDIFSFETIIIFLAHLLFIFSITLPFDTRDIHIDKKNTLTTFPHLIGIKATKIVSIICLAIFSWIIGNIIFNWYLAVFVLFTAAIILNSSPYKKDHYFTFFLDGTIFLYFISIFISMY